MKTTGYILSLFFFILAPILPAAGPVAAQTGELSKSTPIQIEADRMESRRQRNTVLFSGNVVAKQADLTIHADQMTVDYKPSSESEAAGDVTRKIKKLFAKGNVKIIKEGWISTGDTMEYNTEEGKVLVRGNARVWQDRNMVSGESIILYLDEGRSVVERGAGKGERVKAYIYPDNRPEAGK